MEVKSGYKQTEVGVIPEEWNILPLSDLCRSINDGTHFTPTYVSQGVPFYSVENVTANEFTDTKFITEAENALLIRRCKPEKGDILMTRIGSLGDTKLLDWDVNASIYVSLALLKLNERACPEYVYRYTQSSAFVRDVEKRSLLNAIPKKINLGDIGEILIPVPRALPEQRAIAGALSDVDTLIGALDSALAKKRDLKKASMHQLLTGQTRLPGFHGEWEVASFESVFSNVNAKQHQVQTTEYQASGCSPIVDQGKRPVVGFSDREDKRFHCPKGGVVIFGDHTCIVKFVDFDFVVGADGTQILATKPGHCARFYAFQLQGRGIPTTGYNRHFKFLKERSFVSPPLPEQTAIAEVLSDIDAELGALEQRRDKTHALKQGMMQELLTGRTRLV
jgi:type I restriction enzyme S subunit